MRHGAVETVAAVIAEYGGIARDEPVRGIAFFDEAREHQRDRHDEIGAFVSFFHCGGKALTHDAVGEVDSLAFDAFHPHELFAGGEAVRIPVAEDAVSGVYEKRRRFYREFRHTHHKGSYRSPAMGRAKRRERRRFVSHAELFYHIFRVEPAFGMSDEVHFSGSGLFQYRADLFFELRGVVFHRSEAVDAAFVYRAAFFTQYPVDLSP